MDTRRWECRCRIACAGTLDGMTGSKGYAETKRRPRSGDRPLCGGTAEEAHEAAASLSPKICSLGGCFYCVGAQEGRLALGLLLSSERCPQGDGPRGPWPERGKQFVFFVCVPSFPRTPLVSHLGTRSRIASASSGW